MSKRSADASPARWPATTPAPGSLPVSEPLALELFIAALLDEAPAADEMLIPVEVRPENVATPASSPPPCAAPLAPFTTPSVVQASEAPGTGRPGWVGEAFQAVFFRAGAMRLAVPLAELDAIVDWPDQVHRPPGLGAWEIGVMHHRGQPAALLDTGRLLDPERAGDAGACEGGKVLIFGRGRLGLACPEVQTRTISADRVRWRSASAARPWVVGTEPDSMTSLLDPAALAALVDASRYVARR